MREFRTEERPHFYFGYGSNINSEFMIEERVKNGTWCEDGWAKKTGVVEGPAPIDLGTYILRDYAFRYNLREEDNGVIYGTGNIIYSPGSYVLGALYNISTLHLNILDVSEDEGIDYKRTTVKVQKVAFSALGIETLPEEVEAFAHIGIEEKLNEDLTPDPIYRDFLIEGARSRHFPDTYIQDNFAVLEVSEAR